MFAFMYVQPVLNQYHVQPLNQYTTLYYSLQACSKIY